MKPSPIRELARRYAIGELSLEEYRAQRRKLIDGVTSGTLNLEYGEISVARQKRPYLWWSAAIALLFTGLIIGGFAWKWHMHASGQQSTRPENTLATGPAVLQTFITSNDWSDASLVEFLQNWKALPAREQNAAQNSYLFPRLAAQLREQIASQKAVVDLDAGDKNQTERAAAHLAHLQQLAALLGIKISN